MLTDLSCKALITLSKKQNKPLKKADRHGLFLHAFPSGAAFIKHKYRFGGISKEISFGPYPRLSLRRARELHSETYRQLKDGFDPSHLRQEKLARQKTETASAFESVANAWYEHNLENWSERHARRLKNRLDKNLVLPFKRRPIRSLTRKDLLIELRKIELKSKETAKRCTQYLLGIFRYALDAELVEANVALDLASSLKPRKQGHYPSMRIDELPEFLLKLDGIAESDAEDKRDILTLLMLTLVRSKELLAAEWTEFDLQNGIWTIPASRMKMREPHIVPLSKQANDILTSRFDWNVSTTDQSPYKFVFPSLTKYGVHVRHTIGSDALREMGYRGIHTCHGFRALGMGIAMEKLGYPFEVPDRQLAHLPKGTVRRAYDRAQFLDQRKKMMQELADYIDNAMPGTNRKVQSLSAPLSLDLA